MKPVMLIEDRIHRQKNHFGDNLNTLNKFSFLKNISGGADFVEIKNKLTNSEFSILDSFSVIMLHRSAFETNTRNGLLDYSKRTGKKVVFFSGGISGCQITKIGNLEFLLINVSQFYSDNLVFFLENEEQNLIELAFGKDWKLSILIDAYEKLTIYIKNFKDRPWAKIEEDLKLNNAIIDNYFRQHMQKQLLSKVNLEEILTNMNKDLNELI